MNTNQFVGFIDPSIYAVIINAEQAGWVPRPPNIELDNIDRVIDKLSETSNFISSGNELDLRFAASLHERKHFLDLHLSISLWRLFLSWFYCSSHVFSLITILKDKNIMLPLYTTDGILCSDLLFGSAEREYIQKICDPIFNIEIDAAVKYAMEVNATLLQYSCFTEKYNLNEHSSYLRKHLEHYYYNPLNKFDGNINKAFSFYNICSWFCLSYDEIMTVEKYYLNTANIQVMVKKLFSDKYFTNRIDSTISNDEYFLDQFYKHYKPLDISVSVDMSEVLANLIIFRNSVLSDRELLFELLTDIEFHKYWIANEGMRIPYIVDFGHPLAPNTEITENYSASKWIIPNNQFLYYNDNIGVQLLDYDDLDNLINQQTLAGFLISPFKVLPFISRICTEEFLECKITDERLTGN